MPRRNPVGGARYMLTDLDDADFALLLDASSGGEALVEARRLTGKRRGRYQVVRITDEALMNPGPVAGYQAILAHLRAIQWLSWTGHWQAKGPSFYGDHNLLERLYTGKKGGPDIIEAIDMLGERIVAYFGPQHVEPILINDKVKSILAGIKSKDPFKALLQLEDNLQVAIKRAWQQNQQSPQMSLGLDDYLMGLANERDTVRYLLRQRIES